MSPTVTRSASGDPALKVPGDDVGALADQVRVTTVRLTRQLRQRDRSGLSITQYAALASVVDHDALSIGGLAAREHQPSPAASRIADCLEAAGLLIRERNPQDGRGVILHATERGRAVVTAQRARGNAWLASRLAALSPQQRDLVAGGIEVLSSAILGADAAGETGEVPR
ncbi:MAG: MarR family winged helix-turn-helix transcriptional regulator [Acidimicrobiales bacterium]